MGQANKSGNKNVSNARPAPGPLTGGGTPVDAGGHPAYYSVTWRWLAQIRACRRSL